MVIPIPIIAAAAALILVLWKSIDDPLENISMIILGAVLSIVVQKVIL